jgi:hypothetical protein
MCLVKDMENFLDYSWKDLIHDLPKIGIGGSCV